MTTRIESTPGLSADLSDDAGAVRVEFHVPVGYSAVARGRLADAVLDDPSVRRTTRLYVSLPIGEAEILAHLQGRCSSVRARAAGSTCLVEVDLDADHAGT